MGMQYLSNIRQFIQERKNATGTRILRQSNLASANPFKKVEYFICVYLICMYLLKRHAF